MIGQCGEKNYVGTKFCTQNNYDHKNIKYILLVKKTFLKKKFFHKTI